MARFLIQSLVTGLFLVPDLHEGQLVWVGHLREAGGGVVSDAETAWQLVSDHCDPEDQPTLVDLDRLGTANDYPVIGEGGGDGGARVAGASGGAALPFLPVGNHGDNDFSRSPASVGARKGGL